METFLHKIEFESPTINEKGEVVTRNSLQCGTIYRRFGRGHPARYAPHSFGHLPDGVTPTTRK